MCCISYDYGSLDVNGKKVVFREHGETIEYLERRNKNMYFWTTDIDKAKSYTTCSAYQIVSRFNRIAQTHRMPIFGFFRLEQ